MKSGFYDSLRKMGSKEQWVFAMLVFLLWIYLILRGIFVQPMHDEVATFFTFVKSGRFLPYFSDWTTNNHLLNSLLTWFSFKTFGSSPIALRLPNLLFFPFFGYFLWKIAAYLNSGWLRWGFLISILFIHHFIEFFALSRGYGMAFTLLVGSIWFTMKAMESNQIKNQVMALGLGFLSVSAILINVNSLIVVIGLLMMNLIFNTSGKKQKFTKIIVLIIGVIPALLAVRYLFDLNTAGRLDYGGDQGFWEASVKDLTSMLVGDLSGWLNGYILLLFAVLIVLTGYFIFNEWQKKPGIRLLFDPRWVLFYLLTGNLAGFFIEHHLFGVLYPGNRTSIQFIIFFLGSIFFFLDNLNMKVSSAYSFLLLPLMFFPMQFLVMANLNKISIENEAIPGRFFNTIQESGLNTTIQPTIQGYKGRELRWAYLNYRAKTQMPMIHCSSYPDSVADFQMAYPDQNPSWWQTYDSIDSDEVSGLYLLERKSKFNRRKLTEETIPPIAEMHNDEYFAISRGSVDSLANAHLFAEFDLSITTSDQSFEGWIVFTIQDKDGQGLRYERIPLNWYNLDWKKGQELKTGMLITDLPEGSSTYLTYIWNIHQMDFQIKSLNFTLFIVEKH